MNDLSPEAEAVPVADWMSQDTGRVDVAASISEVSLLMSQRKHSCVIVCEQDKAVGLISERDVVRVLA
ncbi:MAG: CBS domain-containing protein, partial [Gammaproteobacteria bacterium]|nr:CBS domain-containing protein [Gammaproteobacteria bacterium]